MLAIETDLDHTQCSTSLWRLTYDLLVESARQSTVRVNVAMWVVGATEARHVERLEELRSCVRSRAAGRSNDGEPRQRRGSREHADAGHSHPNCIPCTSAQYTPVAAQQKMSRTFSHLCSTQFVESANKECRPQGRSQTERHRAASLDTGLQSESFFSAGMRCISFMATP